MARISIIGLVFAVLGSVVSASPAKADLLRHACPDHWSGLISDNTEIAYKIADIWDPFVAPKIEQFGTIAFTDQPGTFLNINCTDGRVTQTERQEFYPIGMILKPLRVLTLSDDQKDVFVDPRTGVKIDVPRTYLLVLTEYGHLKIIRERDVQYMIEGATYFFAKSNNFIYLCEDQADCPGNQRLVQIDDAQPEVVCKKNQCREETAIAPLGGYAVGGRAHFVNGTPRTDWSRVELARQALRLDPNTRNDPNTISNYCTPFRVKSYQRGGIPRLTSSKQEFLTLCMQQGSHRRPPLRDINKQQALKIFEDLAEGIFFRQFGKSDATLISVMNPATGPEEGGRKECTQSISTGAKSNLEVSAKWDLLKGVFGVGAEASAERSSSLSTLISNKEYVRFSNFVAPNFHSDSFQPLEKQGEVYNLLFIVDCNGQVVEKPKAVALDYPSFLDGRMEILAQDLTNAYFGFHGTADAPPPGYDLNSSADRIRAGQFFTVHDIETYYLWKSTIRTYLEYETSVGDLIQDIEDTSRRDMVRDFFTHLLMAAIFRYDIPYEPRVTERIEF